MNNEDVKKRVIDKEKLAYEYIDRLVKLGDDKSIGVEGIFLAGFDKAESLYKAEVERLKVREENYCANIDKGIFKIREEFYKNVEALQKEKAKNKELVEALEKIRCKHENAGRVDKQIVHCCIANEALKNHEEG